MSLLGGLTGAGGGGANTGGALASVASAANPYMGLIQQGADLLTFRAPEQSFILGQIQTETDKERESNRIVLIAIIVVALFAVGLMLYFAK